MIVRDTVLTQEGVVWVLTALLAFVWKGMICREDTSVGTFPAFPSPLTESQLPSERWEVVPLLFSVIKAAPGFHQL